jgi:CBS domain-containing protein
MFSVYGKAGRIFRGSMEELRKIGPKSVIGRVQPAPGVGRDGTDGLVYRMADMAQAAGNAVGAAPDHARREAVAAYAQTAHNQPQRHPLALVRDIMNPGAITLAHDANVAQAWETLAQHRLGQAPVVDQEGVLVGLLTRADLLRLDRMPGPHTHALVWQAWLAQPVTELMFTPVPSVAPDTDIRRLARVLLDTGLPGLPVVDDAGRVMAFASRTDILRAVVADPPLDLWS